jgi:MFS family permease
MRTRSAVRVAVACIVMQAGLGTAYAWSVFRNPIAERFGWSLAEVSLTFSAMILTAGFGAYAGGVWLERAGPRRVAVTSGLLYGSGIVLAGLLSERDPGALVPRSSWSRDRRGGVELRGRRARRDAA